MKPLDKPLTVREQIRLLEALAFYADYDTYFACAFRFDRPTGGFDEDFSKDPRFPKTFRPGKKARKVINAIAKARGLVFNTNAP